MAFLFESFDGWKKYSIEKKMSLVDVVLEYETDQKGGTREQIFTGLSNAWDVMKDAVRTGLEEDMTSRSGMINNGGKKVYRYPTAVLSKEFQNLIARALAAKEVNSCMGRIVAAPTAGASGIMPGVLYTVQEIHGIADKKILEAMVLAAGIALIIEQKASIAGAVGGCQAETGPLRRWAQEQLFFVWMEVLTRSSMLLPLRYSACWVLCVILSPGWWRFRV